jgi:flagella basal body P-ring formation protein FlgA
MRIIFLILATTAFFVANAAGGPVAPMPTLKASPAVDNDFVRLGDLIENAGEAAQAPLFRAPELGSTGTIQVYRIIEAARAHGLSVFDTRGMAEIMVTRASRTIPLQEIERAVSESASRQYGLGEAKDIAVSLDSGVRPLAVEPSISEAPRMAQFSYDPRSQRFEGTIDVPGSAAVRRKAIRISGRLIETVEVVTLARAVTRGEIVRENDVLIERRSKAEISPDIIRQPSGIVGQAARRDLRFGQIVRSVELMKPELVGRNDPVTLIFDSPGILVSVRAKALESGTEGDMVQVLNPQSKRVVQAMVEGPGRVVVRREPLVRDTGNEATGSVK